MTRDAHPFPKVAEQSLSRAMQSSITPSKKQAKKRRVQLYVADKEHVPVSNLRTKGVAHTAATQPPDQPPKRSLKNIAACPAYEIIQGQV